jgi:hypothetical protein
MEIVYPPVGIAHIIDQIPDLIADRMTTASQTRVACAMQPKAAPHFGTGIVILTAFALARLFQENFRQARHGAARHARQRPRTDHCH